MAKVGYIFKANSYDALDADKEWMRQYGCVQVVEEECAHEALRPQWKQLMASLGRGDELVVATNHQATGNEEGHVEGGTGKNHRGYVQQRLFDRRHLGGERL